MKVWVRLGDDGLPGGCDGLFQDAVYASKEVGEAAIAAERLLSGDYLEEVEVTDVYPSDDET